MPPKHNKTAKTTALVLKMHRAGATHEEMFDRLGITDKTFTLHYSKELKHAFLERKMKFEDNFYKRSEKSDAIAMFLARTKFGFSEAALMLEVELPSIVVKVKGNPNIKLEGDE